MVVKNSKKRNYTILLILILCVGIGIFVVAQTSRKEISGQNPSVTITPENIPKVVEEIPIKMTPKDSPSYHILTTTTPTPGAEILKEVGSKNLAFTLALNRIDVKHIPLNAVIVIPDSFENLDIYSTFPSEVDALSSTPKLFIVSQEVQAFGAYEYGKLVKWGAVSTGKKTKPTPSNLYSTNWKGKLVISSIEEEWLLPWAFNIDSDEGISIHQFDLPGYPASHSCVRLSENDAMWFYEWAEQWILTPDGQTRIAHGTPVIIFGEYSFNQIAPWKKLADDPKATTVTISEINKIVEKYLPEIESRLKDRIRILNEISSI